MDNKITSRSLLQENNQSFEEPTVIESSDLFAGRIEIHIRHDGQTYRLRITKNGKLIMNK